MLDLTVVILTKNEENNLRKCIESFRGIAKRFVIVDSYSNDGTIDLCEELINEGQNISIYQHKFTNHASQFNWGLENTEINTTWCMRMDADEEITPELLDELKTELPKVKDEVNGIILKRRVYFLGRWIKHGGKYPELLLRIFRSGYAECEQKLMDEHIVLKSGKTIKLNNDIIDNNNKDLEWWTHKHNWYSNKEVLDYQQTVLNCEQDKLINSTDNNEQAATKRFIKNNGYYRLPMFFRAHLYFIYRYYFRLGFLDGKEGKIYHFLQAYWYRFLVDSKIFESNKFNINLQQQNDLK